MVEVTLEGKPRRLLLDTGSSLCLIQPGVSASTIQATGTNPVGITGDALPLQVEQLIQFTLGNKSYRQRFGECVLPTEGNGLVGNDFLSANGARLYLSNQTLEFRCFFLTNRNCKREGNVSLTLFHSNNGQPAAAGSS
jgi:hypothetical protein